MTWVSMVASSFCGVVNFDMIHNDESVSVLKSKELQRILTSRFENRITYCEHFAINWFRGNLPRFCDIVCLVGHAADDIDSTNDESITLLAHPQEPQSRFVKASDSVSDTEGSYLHYDRGQHRWVHSGIAVGCNCGKRTIISMQNEHERYSRADATGAPNSNVTRNDNSSSSTRLALLYPEKSISSNSTVRKGWFGQLDQYCGICFCRDKDVSSLYIEEGGIFSWDTTTLEKLESTDIGDCTSLHEKQLMMIGCCLQLGYSLMISKYENVCSTVGFDVFLSGSECSDQN